MEEEDAGTPGRGATETGATGELRQQVLQMWTAGPLGQELQRYVHLMVEHVLL